MTGVAGDEWGWNVVMSTGVAGDQALVGFDFDTTQITQRMEEGYRISSIGGWKDKWVVVMNTETGWGVQRYSLPTPMTESRREWIDARWKEGSRITALAGDDDPAEEQDGWMVVMTQKTDLQEQSIVGPGEWPWQTIAEKLEEGFAVTSVTGSGDRWLVVLSKGTGLRDQVMSEPGEYPSAWIKERW